MKRFLVIAASAALLLTSCSEEKFLNDVGLEQGTNAGKGAIELQPYQPNQSRATALEYFTDNFGVFGLKANLNNGGQPALPAEEEFKEGDQVVFNNYLVGYYKTYPLSEENDGLNETGGTPTTTFSSNWYYEGLGKEEYHFPDGVTKSAWDNQYLKYWDAAYKFTYFVAYTPYENTTPPELKLSDDHTPYLFKLDFTDPIALNDGASLMVAGKQEEVAGHIGTNSTVNLKFHRSQPQVRIAFYEVIKGYDVQMVSMDATNEDNAPIKVGVTAMPYTYDEENTTNPYGDGTMKLNRKVSVSISKPTQTDQSEDLECKFKYQTTDVTNPDGYDYLDFNIDKVYLYSPNGEETTYLHEERSKKAFSSTVYNVFPLYDDTDNPKPTEKAVPFQFVMSFKLIAKDTKEVITVHNARVNIPAEYAQWKENCLYTYIFKITKNTTGTTTLDPYDPIHPDTPVENALCPIVFDQLTVADLSTENATEFTLYDAQHNPTAKDGFIFKSDIRKDFVAQLPYGGELDLMEYMLTSTDTDYYEKDYQALLASERVKMDPENTEYDSSYAPNFKFSSDDETIAKMKDNKSNLGIVSAIAPGTTTIHVEYPYTKEINGAQVEFTAKDAIIVTVIIDNKFLSNAKLNLQVNATYDLDDLVKSDKDAAKVTGWYMYNTTSKEYEALSATTNNIYAYNPTDHTIRFKQPEKIYRFKATYHDDTLDATDYFFVEVNGNEFLKYSKIDWYTQTGYDLNDLLKEEVNANRVKWYVDGTELKVGEDLPTGVSSYTETSGKRIVFSTPATHILKAEYINNPTVTEYISLTLTLPPEP